MDISPLVQVTVSAEDADTIGKMPLESLNPKRRCVCEEHTGYERWHGKLTGHQYHRCDCLDCKHAWSAYLSTPARRAAQKVQNARRSNARRARSYGTKHELYAWTDIAERDEWTCGICNRPIDRQAKWPAAESFSLDHITPLSRGGADVKSNVQAAHLKCNNRKRAKVAEA